MTDRSPSVLVTDGLWRKSVSAIRALGRRGVDVGVTGDSQFTTGFYSRYCGRRVILPPTADASRWVDALERELEGHRYDVIFPMEAETIELVLEHRERIERLVRVPLPATSSFDIANDKGKATALAQTLGIPTPRSVLLEPGMVTASAMNELQPPFIVKPVDSSGSRGIRYASTRLELDNVLRAVAAGDRHRGGFIVQERLDAKGPGVGAALLFDEAHRAVAGFTYRRLREYPITGGPSTLRESTDDPQLLEFARRLLESLAWVGVAMVEFKVDTRDGSPKFLEVNPRFWGSLELPIAAGVDFPYLLYRSAMGEDFPPVFEYQLGVQSRWLVPGDVLNFVANLRRGRLVRDFFRFRAPGLHYDDFSRDDLGGSLATLWCTAAQALRPSMWRLAVKRS